MTEQIGFTGDDFRVLQSLRRLQARGLIVPIAVDDDGRIPEPATRRPPPPEPEPHQRAQSARAPEPSRRRGAGGPGDSARGGPCD